jgi:hypothetical protein
VGDLSRPGRRAPFLSVITSFMIDKRGRVRRRLLTDDGVIAVPPALVRASIETLPAAIAADGARTSERFIEFFTANIRNRNTRMAYAVAVRQFFNRCEQ